MKIVNDMDFNSLFNKREGFVMRDAEKWLYTKIIEEALKRCFYNMSKAAQVLGISRATLSRKIHDLDIDLPYKPITEIQRLTLEIERLEKGEFTKIKNTIVRYNGKYYYTDCGKTSKNVRLIVDYIK